MFSARLLVLLLVSAAFARRPESSKPPRAAAVSDASATRVHNSFDPAPYSALFQPENLDLTGFFGPQFVPKQQNHGVDIGALYAQYGSPHQHFSFNYPGKDQSQAAQPSRQQDFQRFKQSKLPQQVEASVPNKQQASEEVYYGSHYAQPPAYVQAQPQYAAVQQAYGPAIHEPVPNQQPIRGYAPGVAFQQQHQQQQAVQYHPHGHPGIGVQPQAQAQPQLQVQPTVAPHAVFQQSAYQQPNAMNFQQAYQQAYQQQQQDQPQLQVAGRPPTGKVNLQAVLQSQVLPQIKGAQGIQLLDLSEFFPPKEGQQPVYFHINPSEDYKTASLTPVQLNSFYQAVNQQQQQQQQQQPGALAKPSSAIPAAAVREPTLSPAEVAAYLQQQSAYAGQTFAPQTSSHHQSQPSSRPSSYTFSQLSSTPFKQQHADLSAYYSQQTSRPEETGAVYHGQPIQFTEQDVPRQHQVYYAAQPTDASAEEVQPSKAPSNEAQYFKASVAKAVKKVQKASQLAHLTSQSAGPSHIQSSPANSGKPPKVRQLVKKPHTHGPGYSFEIAGANKI
ncbi:Hypothetical predicted protein [Cloeon dipterum]|uniref:Uncharacterized protein n=1 Tax=Cloeon dipterum TaxID=197152 RepID=A0A8S1CKU2_9INSE|nr:Hypothetical predicted protein [Cloeon dipterum]